jgi:hypothetical protein
MDKHAGEVVAGRFETEDLAIQHVRNPGERVPVAGVYALECPQRILQTLPNVGITRHIFRFILSDEIVVERARKCHQDGDK